MISKETTVAAVTAILDEIEINSWRRLHPEAEFTPRCLIEDAPLSDYMLDPVGAALRAGLKEIGRSADATFTFDEITEIGCEAAAARDERFRERLDVIRRQWNQIAGREWIVWQS